jgi:uncharacterized iron-regulated membrane protein
MRNSPVTEERIVAASPKPRGTAQRTMRKVHRILAVASALPLVVIICSGLLLQLKKHVTWIQPATLEGSQTAPSLGFEELLRVARTVPEASIETWSDIERVDIRPASGVGKIWAKNRHEVQVDMATGAVLQVAYRRSDLIESIHDGSFFHDAMKLGVFLPCGVALLVLWGTGLYLWWLPHGMRRRRSKSRHPRA